MTQPLIVVAYEKLLPGSQLVNRLEDHGYRVKSISDVALILETVVNEKPLLVIIDMEPRVEEYAGCIAKLRSGSETSHIPIIALTEANNLETETVARRSGSTLVVSNSAILAHLEQFLQQALEI